MHLHDEDLKLQIRLAELQAEIQTRLTLVFSFLAISVSILLALQQFYISEQQIVDKNYIVMSIIGGIVVFGFVFVHLLREALAAKSEIGKLRKQYILRGRMPTYLKPEREHQA